MIELNLTYEESKKILDLGYDFSKVCPFYRVVKGKSISLFNGIEFIFNLGLIDRLENEVLAELDREKLYHDSGYSGWNYLKSLVEKNIFTEIIPLIPKAALEACLPSKLDVASLDDCVFVNNLDLGAISLSYFFEEYYSCYEEQKEFNSAFEAFMWCHKNYPEELKAKFDEVMG